MEDILVDKEYWEAVDLGTKPTATLMKDQEKLDRKARTTIRFWYC